MNSENKADYIVILDDDPIVKLIIEKTLGMNSRFFKNPQILANSLEDLSPKAVFVDIQLGVGRSNGLDLVPLLRKHWPFVPILIVTSSPTENSIAYALASGADDFIRKPIIPEELSARLKLRLGDIHQKKSKEVVDCGNISIDTSQRVITGPKGQRHGSPIEINLLGLLASRNGQTIDKEAIKAKCWGPIHVSDNALHRKLHAVRKILKDVSDDVTITSQYGIGFALTDERANNLQPTRTL